MSPFWTQLNLWTAVVVLAAGLAVSLKMRSPLGPIISLAGGWMFVIGVTLFDLGATKPVSFATFPSILLLLAFGGLLIVAGLVVIVLGLGTFGWQWKRSTQEAKYGHLRSRREDGLDYPHIDGRPELIIAPERPGHPQLELVRLNTERDWPSRDFPDLN